MIYPQQIRVPQKSIYNNILYSSGQVVEDFALKYTHSIHMVDIKRLVCRLRVVEVAFPGGWSLWPNQPPCTRFIRLKRVFSARGCLRIFCAQHERSHDMPTANAFLWRVRFFAFEFIHLYIYDAIKWHNYEFLPFDLQLTWKRFLARNHIITEFCRV